MCVFRQVKSGRVKELQLIEKRIYDLADNEVPVFLSWLKELRDVPVCPLSNPVPISKKRKE